MGSLTSPCRLSIIVPFYNSERFLKRCVESIENQSLPSTDFELLMIDDGSTDSGAALVTSLSRQYPNIRLVQQANKGQGMARNLGVQQAQGTYLMFVDADDYIKAHSIAEPLSTCEQLQADIYYTQAHVHYPTGEGTIDSEYAEAILGKQYTGEKLLLAGVNVGAVWGKFFLRDFLIRNQLTFNKGFSHEDVDFMFRCLAKADSVYFTDHWFYEYCWNEGSTDRGKSKEHALRSIKSTLQVAANLYTQIQSDENSIALRQYFERKRNSMVFGTIHQLFVHSEQFTEQEVRTILEYAKDSHLYPLQGTTCSWKSRWCLPFYNHPPFFLLMIRIKKLFQTSAKHNS